MQRHVDLIQLDSNDSFVHAFRSMKSHIEYPFAFSELKEVKTTALAIELSKEGYLLAGVIKGVDIDFRENPYEYPIYVMVKPE